MNEAKFDGKKVKVLCKQIITMTNMYEAHKIGDGTLRITLEALLGEINGEIEKLRK
jgi:hypothetical protein